MGGCAWFVVVCIAALAILLALDPFRLSPISDYPNFTALPVPVRPLFAPPFPRDHLNKLHSSHITFLHHVIGPESIAFDSRGRGPYTGTADGRIMLWNGPQIGWTEFATIYLNGSANCMPQSPPVANLAYEHECGRPLGIHFMEQTGELYIADAYFGLLVVGPDGGQAKILVSEAEGKPFAFTNDVEISNEGHVYFTVTSSQYPRRQFLLTAFSGDQSGRLLSYDPATKEVRVLFRGLQSPNGVAISKDGSFLVVAESAVCRVRRFWLKGEKAGTMEIFAELPGFPDNVRVNEKGQFWVAIYCRQSLYAWMLMKHPWLRRALLQLPLSFKQLNYIFVGGQAHAMALLLDQDGQLQEVLEDQTGKTIKFISEVEERDGQLWMGSVLMPYIAIYSM